MTNPTDKAKADEVALELACMIGSMEGEDYADSVYRSAELYEELTGKKLGLKRPKHKKKWYQFWKD